MNKLFLSNEAISIAIRDFLKFIIILVVKLVKQILFFKLFVKCHTGLWLRTGCVTNAQVSFFGRTGF